MSAGGGEMGRFWDERAKEDAFYFVDDRLEYGHPDEERLWARGREALDIIFDSLGVVPGRQDTVVDVGCGLGRLTREICGRARQVVALDVSADARRRAPAERASGERALGPRRRHHPGRIEDAAPTPSSRTSSSSTSPTRSSPTATSARWAGCSSLAAGRASTSRTTRQSTGLPAADGASSSGSRARSAARPGARAEALELGPRWTSTRWAQPPRTAGWPSIAWSTRAPSTAWCSPARPPPSVDAGARRRLAAPRAGARRAAWPARRRRSR